MGNELRNYRYSIKDLFLIMSSIYRNDEKALNIKYNNNLSELTYLVDRLQEGKFVTLVKQVDYSSVSDIYSNLILTYKGHEYMKIWNETWIKNKLEIDLGHKIEDMSMYTFFHVANKMMIERIFAKTTDSQ